MSWAEELFAGAAPEQEREVVQVASQLGNAVGGVAHELFKGGAKAARIAGGQRVRNCSISARLG